MNMNIGAVLLPRFSASLLVIWMCGCYVEGHGLMTEPPSRNTMWRYGFSNPKNYDDMALNCGGFDNQWGAQGGKCGVCGDPYQGPLKHQPGYPGGYANGIIGRVYKAGDFIKIRAKITANHLGHMQYKICPVNDKDKKATQSCLDRYPLRDASGNKKFEVYDHIKNGPGEVEVKVQLPAGLTCSQCVIQWTYTAGNNGGNKQETFKNCADVQITVEGGSGPNPQPEINPLKRRDGGVTKLDANNNPVGQYDCDVQDPFNKGEKHQQIYDWCLQHCIEVAPEHRSCPESHCKCYRLDAYKSPYKEDEHSTSAKTSTKSQPSPEPSYPQETFSDPRTTSAPRRRSHKRRHSSRRRGGRDDSYETRGNWRPQWF